jgi:hypothetical protein
MLAINDQTLTHMSHITARDLSNGACIGIVVAVWWSVSDPTAGWRGRREKGLGEEKREGPPHLLRTWLQSAPSH